MVPVKKRRPKRLARSSKRGIYILPNLLTTGALFFGFFAIIQASYGRFDMSAIAVLIAMVLDGLDGRVARLTNTTSEFGKAYDSLSDVICFGLTPALVLFEWSISSLGKMGWLCAFVYVAATALRLARFNTHKSKDPGYFQGLPCPPAAALLATWMWVMHNAGLAGSFTVTVLTALIVATLAFAMVSNVPYLSFKNVDLKGKIPFIATVAMVLAIVLISVDPPRILFAIALIYALSGPVVLLKNRLKKSKPEEQLIAQGGEQISTESEQLAKKDSSTSGSRAS